MQARIFIPLTLVLAMITLGMSAFRRAGDISQITADDIYQLVCYAFVFSGLLTYGIVHKTATRRKYSKHVKDKEKVRFRSRTVSHLRSLFRAIPRRWKARDLRKARRATEEDTPSTAYQLMGHNEEAAAETAGSDARPLRDGRLGQETETQAEREQRAHQIDLKARWLFPLCFAFFNIGYWAYWIPNY